MSALLFGVSGTPVPQGSKRAWVNRKTGRAVMVEAAGIRHTNWRTDVRAIAAQTMADEGIAILKGAVVVDLSFSQPRPKNHYGTGKNADTLKPDAPAYPHKAPDVDKLVRAVLDSMTGSVFVDDGQVVRIRASKAYVDRGLIGGVLVEVWDLG